MAAALGRFGRVHEYSWHKPGHTRGTIEYFRGMPPQYARTRHISPRPHGKPPAGGALPAPMGHAAVPARAGRTGPSPPPTSYGRRRPDHRDVVVIQTEAVPVPGREAARRGGHRCKIACRRLPSDLLAYLPHVPPIPHRDDDARFVCLSAAA